LALPVTFADFQPHYLLLAMQVRDVGGKSRRVIARRPLAIYSGPLFLIFWTVPLAVVNS